MKKSTTRWIVIFICMLIAAVGYYAYLSNRTRTEKEEAAMTVVESTLSRDLSMDYPATPKEVIKYYNQILRCFYNEDCTEEEIEQLGNKARQLYDEELLAQNSEEDYISRLKLDIQGYKDKKRTLSSASVAASTSVVYDTIDGYSFARILCGYSIKDKDNSYPVKQVYLLRKDDEKKWKIYGWEDASKLESSAQ